MTDLQKLKIKTALLFGVVGTIISLILDYVWSQKAFSETVFTGQTLFRWVLFTGLGYFLARPKKVEKQ